MTKEINIDHIGVVKETNGSYTYEQVEIKHSNDLLVSLEAMCENPNRTVLEMQDYFTAHFGTKPKTAYDCCLPHAYNSSYIGYVCLPEMITIEQYHQRKQEIVENTRKEFEEQAQEIVENTRKELEEQAKDGQFITSFSNEQIEKETNNRISNWNNNLKERFHRESVRYIQAVDFTTTTESIKKNGQIRMLSHEHIGWTTIKHKISDDLIITINTNFGYGASSYFMFNVCYKGIDLLPYALLVKYYYAGIAEIKRCTRSYRPDRENWALAMDFVADVGNKTKAGELSFVHNWLKCEIDEMITRLYAINEDPMKILNKIFTNRPPLHLYDVRMADEGEIKRLKLYPDEMVIVFKASKLTAALDLIDKLHAAGEVYEPALEAIHNIKEINRLFAPELDKSIAELSEKLKELAQILQLYREQLFSVKEKLTLHNKKISDLYKEDIGPNKSTLKITEEYRKIHPEFVKLEQSRDKLETKIININSRIQNYNSFSATLQKCYQRIENKVLKYA